MFFTHHCYGFTYRMMIAVSPGRLESQLGISTDATNEWAVERITGHYGRRSEAIFEVLWKSGDSTWMPYDQASKLVALNEYLETIGIPDIKALPYGSGKPPADDPQVFAGSVGLDFETPLEALVNLLNLFPMVWHGDIIENSKISADYAEWNSAHPFCIRQNRESFVLYTDDPTTAARRTTPATSNSLSCTTACSTTPTTISTITRLWPSLITSGELSLPTLQEFMVRDSDVFVTTLPKGKVIVDEEFQKHGIALILDADSRRSRAIETSKEKVAIRRAGEFEGKLSPEERAKLAAKVASSRAEYVKRVGKKTTTPANPQGEGDSGVGGAGGGRRAKHSDGRVSSSRCAELEGSDSPPPRVSELVSYASATDEDAMRRVRTGIRNLIKR
ncbi:hypothetical protein B0H14DRAFT_3491861 [Mycena olivaceomarginata]|nr:hypothetical protein B0H14DRAFT_3491861 [Mycena olivaceomarginata]